MKQWHPCKRRILIKRLHKLGFNGLFSGTRHQFMVFGYHRLSIPSNTEYSLPQLRMILNEVEAILGRSIPPDEWNSLT